MTSLSHLRQDGLEVRQPLFLREFAKAFEDDYVSVWVNPTSAFYTDWDALVALENNNREKLQVLAEANDGLPSTEERAAIQQDYRIESAKVLARLWDCDAEAVDVIRDHSAALFLWCVKESFIKIGLYGAKRKKD